MLEQEIASIIKFVLQSTGNPTPYYSEVPEGFLIPSAYFPPPEIESRGDTFNTYALEYTWFIKLFHINEAQAHELAFPALTAIKAARNLIPLIDVEGNHTNNGFRIKSALLKTKTDSLGVAQLTLSWDSRRTYDEAEVQKMMTYDLDLLGQEAHATAVQLIMQDATKSENEQEETL